MVSHIRINGIKNPVGFSFEKIRLSYWLNEGTGKNLTVFLYEDERCQKSVYRQNLNPKESFCTVLGFIPKLETRYYLKITDGKEESEVAYFETATKFDAPFISPCSDYSHPVLYRSFSVKRNPVWARIYVTGLGLYEAYLNGEKIGNEYLTPNCNDYDEYVQYQTYDITSCLQTDNTVEILFGNGWYKGRFGLKHRTSLYGNEYAAAAKIMIRYDDGSVEILKTDDSWRARNSTLVDSGIYDGEVVDETVPHKESGVRYATSQFQVIPRTSLPIVEKLTIKPTLIVSPKGERILDFGQNFAGFVRFQCNLQKGQKIVLSAGEVLQEGCFYRTNLRTAKAEFVYTSDGVCRTVRPHFTYYGFRYMLVEGLEEINPDDFTGVVLYSDLEETVKIKTDNEKVNRLLENCKWGQRSNFIDVPTDCPQRDERLGWTGDAEVFSATACYQMECRAFYDKYLKDVEIDQLKYGTVTTFSPAVKDGDPAGSVWGDVATILPWNLYRFYGDKILLEKHYPMMTRYVERIIKEDDERGGRRLYDFGFHLGDWLAQDGASPNSLKGATDEYFIASMYYYKSMGIVADAARVLGKQEDYKRYGYIARQIRKAILDNYFSPVGRSCIDTQTAYVLCLAFGVYRNKQKLIADFSKRLRADSYKIKGGFVGATQMLQAMLSAGMSEEAFRMLYRESYPGWLACVNLGATTIWERWNSLNADGSMSETGMNSLNHYSYGSVAEAFYAYIAGLRPMTPGFKTAVIQPNFNYRLKKLDFSYASPCGVYEISYRIDSNICLRVKIPKGCRAVLKLEGEQDKRLTEGEHEFTIPCKESFDCPFSIESPVCDLLECEKTRAALQKSVPTLTTFLTYSDMGLNGEALSAITSMSTFFVPLEKMKTIDAELRQIKYDDFN